jgi:hypothetical protein
VLPSILQCCHHLGLVESSFTGNLIQQFLTNSQLQQTVIILPSNYPLPLHGKSVVINLALICSPLLNSQRLAQQPMKETNHFYKNE